jgi:hypothetical protein
MSIFIEIEVDEGDGIDDPVQLRFKQVTPPQPVARALFDGGWWRIEALDGGAQAALVEDSSDGEARLVFGGSRGLRVTSEASGEVRREPYLLLARGAELG